MLYYIGNTYENTIYDIFDNSDDAYKFMRTSQKLGRYFHYVEEDNLSDLVMFYSLESHCMIPSRLIIDVWRLSETEKPLLQFVTDSCSEHVIFRFTNHKIKLYIENGEYILGYEDLKEDIWRFTDKITAIDVMADLEVNA